MAPAVHTNAKRKVKERWTWKRVVTSFFFFFFSLTVSILNRQSGEAIKRRKAVRRAHRRPSVAGRPALGVRAEGFCGCGAAWGLAGLIYRRRGDMCWGYSQRSLVGAKAPTLLLPEHLESRLSGSAERLAPTSIHLSIPLCLSYSPPPNPPKLSFQSQSLCSCLEWRGVQRNNIFQKLFHIFTPLAFSNPSVSFSPLSVLLKLQHIWWRTQQAEKTKNKQESGSRSTCGRYHREDCYSLRSKGRSQVFTEGPLQWSFNRLAPKPKSRHINTLALTYILNSCDKHDTSPRPPRGSNTRRLVLKVAPVGFCQDKCSLFCWWPGTRVQLSVLPSFTFLL